MSLGQTLQRPEGLRFGYWRDTRTSGDRALVRPAARETQCVFVSQLENQGIQGPVTDQNRNLRPLAGGSMLYT